MGEGIGIVCMKLNHKLLCNFMMTKLKIIDVHNFGNYKLVLALAWHLNKEMKISLV